VAARYRHHALLHIRLETGRTHQIRVHLADARYPIVGDPVYGGRAILPRGTAPGLNVVLQSFKRQALHAWRLTLQHPLTDEECCWEATLPADMQGLLLALEQDAKIETGTR
jgi:23S rRNA pseudouridine1911/1915/1917 synthase